MYNAYIPSLVLRTSLKNQTTPLCSIALDVGDVIHPALHIEGSGLVLETTLHVVYVCAKWSDLVGNARLIGVCLQSYHRTWGTWDKQGSEINWFN